MGGLFEAIVASGSSACVGRATCGGSSAPEEKSPAAERAQRDNAAKAGILGVQARISAPALGQQ
jgi:hypothetical protein